MKIYNSSHTGLGVDQIGGKAFNLFHLKRLGMNVPDWIVLDQSFLEEILPETLKINADSEAIKAFIDSYSFPQELLNEIDKNLGKNATQLFAVRSSGVMEDGALHSFAGQYETHLYVSYEDIPKFIKEVWKSNFSERVFTYLKTNNLQPKFGIAVVIQEMIDPEISGVAFGIDPSTGEKDSKVICSVYGVGEGLVSGQLDSDTYKLSGTKISETLVQKTHAARKFKSGEIKLEAIATEIQSKSSLNQKQILELKTILDTLEKKLGTPQDIEFAIKNSTIYLLQTRPVTAIIKSESPGKNRIIWDNSNIIESYPGVTTPLTFSYISTAYKHVYLQLAEIMGASKKTLKENEATFANMLGLINGRVYYNLLSWYKVLALFPGYKLNAQFMENMMGVKERFELPPSKSSSKLAAIFRSLLMISRIIGHLFTIKSTTRKFLSDVNLAIDGIKKMKLETMSAYELKEAWINLDADLTPKWKAPVINDSFAMIYFGRLQKTIEKYNISENKNIQNDLLCGSKDIISVEPIHRSIALATEISANEELKKLFSDHTPSEIWKLLQDNKHHSIREKLEAYIEKFGERCVGELKLETTSFKQDPSLFMATLKSFVIQNVTTASTTNTIDQDLRDAAENEINKALKFRPYRKWKLKRILRKTRYFVSNRENLRYERTRVFGITREIFSQIGIEFFKHQIIENDRDIFYLTKEEIFQFIDGTSVTKDLKNLIKIRKEEYAKFEEMEVPAERFTTYETVNSNNDFFDRSIEHSHDGQLSGLGCCPGIVKARVRLVKHPKEVDSLNGDILVTSSTDPGWVTLFPTASAIIVERGSLLSHSAIVSREMGIPCIVGVTGLLKTLKTGDLIEMNGSTGTIKILDDEQ